MTLELRTKLCYLFVSPSLSVAFCLGTKVTRRGGENNKSIKWHCRIFIENETWKNFIKTNKVIQLFTEGSSNGTNFSRLVRWSRKGDLLSLICYVIVVGSKRLKRGDDKHDTQSHFDSSSSMWNKKSSTAKRACTQWKKMRTNEEEVTAGKLGKL